KQSPPCHIVSFHFQVTSMLIVCPLTFLVGFVTPEPDLLSQPEEGDVSWVLDLQGSEKSKLTQKPLRDEQNILPHFIQDMTVPSPSISSGQTFLMAAIQSLVCNSE
uniref:Uncharacterized protein n=1 Tax=Gopherus evgoodei TaxID=1825980 RepID=A0A8C4WP75_9SAUR